MLCDRTTYQNVSNYNVTITILTIITLLSCCFLSLHSLSYPRFLPRMAAQIRKFARPIGALSGLTMLTLGVYANSYILKVSPQ